jgi:SAM-dependent methyltransferase
MSDYMIRGGVQGRERLRVLSRVMRPATLALIERAGLQAGMTGLDVGCGGGDVSLDLARIVGPSGRIVGIDVDAIKIDIAQREAAGSGVSNVEFRASRLDDIDTPSRFDFVFGRFVMSHLKNPHLALAKISTLIRPGGVIVLADTSFCGHFSYPVNRAFDRYVEVYTETLRRRGGDANIGPRLPRLLIDGGFQHVQMNVVQPAGLQGDVTLVAPLTMENIAEAAVAEGVSTRTETDAIVAELYEFARTPGAFASAARVVEAWGRL